MSDDALYCGKKTEQQRNTLEHLSMKPKEYILMTVQRTENADNPKRLKAILEAFTEVPKRTSVVFTVHLRTKKRIGHCGLQGLPSQNDGY